MKLKFLIDIPLPPIRGKQGYINVGDEYKVDNTTVIKGDTLYYFTTKDGYKAIFPYSMLIGRAEIIREDGEV